MSKPTPVAGKNQTETPAGSNTIMLVIAWLWVGIPLVWGISQTLAKAAALFN